METTDKKSPLLLFAHLHKRTPLTIKMLLITLIVGFVVWAILDQIQTLKLKTIFNAQIIERLSKQAMEDRLSFDRYIKAHTQLITLFITQKKFSDYVEKQNWSASDTTEIKYHKRAPSWFPSFLLLKTFIKPMYTLLLDTQGRVREVYELHPGHTLPQSLLHPSPLLLIRSKGQNFLTKIDGIPYIVTSEQYRDSHGKLRAILIFACHINDEFLINALGSLLPGHVVALLTTGENPWILTSSNMEALPPDMPLEKAKEHYFVTGKGFFDYGDSDIVINFYSFVSKSEVESLVKSVISTQRQHHAIAAPVFILTFVLIMLWIPRRIQRLTQNVVDFSKHTLGIQQQELEKGDQLYVLEGRFQRLTEDILKARDALKKEAEERLLLEKRNMEMTQKEKQLNLLHSVTEAVGVGVIIKTPDGLKPGNQQMEKFINMCGGLSVFDIQDADSAENILLDNEGNKRIFHISTPEILKEEKILLVQDITEIRTHTEALEYMALHDALTGLPNRILFFDRLKQAIFSAQRDRKTFAVLMIDLDQFKAINDTFGHYAGDMVLKEAGTRFQYVLRQADTIARIGGDEFAILLPVSDMENTKEVVYRLLNAVKQPIIVDGNGLYIRTSIGITLYPVHGEDADTLVKRADKAMYAAKENQSGFSIYNGY
ncbi:MAG: GGDEF domain-containing protein [Nitrospirae bacterium]|nr:GGDEF domain-containing protein [Nitrospirota bacterium]